MKKFLKIAICMMIAVCLLSTVAFADASQTQTGEVIGPGAGGASDKQITAEEAARLAGVPADEIAVVNPGQDAAEGDLTIQANGNDNGTLYVFFNDGTGWKLLQTATGNTVTIPNAQAGAYAIAVSAKASPKTGESMLPYFAVVVVIAAAAAAVVVSRKVKA